MNASNIAAHNLGVRRVLDVARQTATILETEAGSGTERDRINIAALRVFADQAAALLLPEPRIADDSEEDEHG